MQFNPDASVVFAIDGRTVGTLTGQFTNATQIQVEGYSGGTTTHVDDLRVRRWTGPEPATSVGAEQTG
jgi:phosphoketolase